MYIWEQLSDEQARDPMGTIYKVQIEVHKLEQQIGKDKDKLNNLNKRLKFLREVVKQRMGEPLENITVAANETSSKFNPPGESTPKQEQKP